MPHWIEGLLIAYAVAGAVTGVILFGFTDLRWQLKVLATVVWPATWLATFVYIMIPGDA